MKEMNATTEMTIGAPSVKTPFQMKREERNRNLREEYSRLMAENPKRSRIAVKDYLKERFGINSDDLYYKILKGA